jgi:hypothetical protein
MSWLFYKCSWSRERLSDCLGLGLGPVQSPSGTIQSGREPHQRSPVISCLIWKDRVSKCRSGWNIQCFSIPENDFLVWTCPVKIAGRPNPAFKWRTKCHCEWTDGRTTFPTPASDPLGSVLFLAPPIAHAQFNTVHSFFDFDNCHPRDLSPLSDVDQTSHGSDIHLFHILSFHQIFNGGPCKPRDPLEIMCEYKTQDSA